MLFPCKTTEPAKRRTRVAVAIALTQEYCKRRVALSLPPPPHVTPADGKACPTCGGAVAVSTSPAVVNAGECGRHVGCSPPHTKELMSSLLLLCATARHSQLASLTSPGVVNANGLYAAVVGIAHPRNAPSPAAGKARENCTPP
eukprot:NODE_26250_length_558_cov_1.139211.p1 GENE.NODE_26250_length_558_cov_1.139211~~NODE_26250_length_558_cov_1.139211.p1  ORF type:complete len:144 (+),score=17.52 NODE_26250_length_558_cov_1.139211:38-469(+)